MATVCVKILFCEHPSDELWLLLETGEEITAPQKPRTACSASITLLWTVWTQHQLPGEAWPQSCAFGAWPPNVTRRNRQFTGSRLSYTLRAQLHILQEQKIKAQSFQQKRSYWYWMLSTLIFLLLLRTMNRNARDYRWNDRQCSSCRHLVDYFSLVESMGAEWISEFINYTKYWGDLAKTEIHSLWLWELHNWENNLHFSQEHHVKIITPPHQFNRKKKKQCQHIM